MKAFVFLLAMLLSGAVGGYAWTRIELGPYGQTPRNIGLDLPQAGEHLLPKLEVLGGSTYDFGTMNFGSTKKHAFTIKNAGQAALHLKMAGTSCRCTLAALPNDELAPGAETSVELEWKANDRHGAFSQTATLETNDPRQPRVVLGVNGRVVGNYLVDGSEVTLTKVPYDKPAHGEFTLYTYTTDPVARPSDIKWKNTDTAQYYQVEFVPLTADDLKREDQPRGGYRGIVTVLPGQATGDFRQTLEFQLDVPDKPTVAVEIRGSVAGRGSIDGTVGWNAEQKVLDLGSLPRGQATRSEGMKIIVRGDQRKELKLTASELSPKFIQAEFGTPVYLEDRDQTHIPFTVIIPADAPAEAHLGQGRGNLGRMAIDPGLPDQPRLRFGIRFSTE